MAGTSFARGLDDWRFTITLSSKPYRRPEGNSAPGLVRRIGSRRREAVRSTRLASEISPLVRFRVYARGVMETVKDMDENKGVADAPVCAVGAEDR